MLMALHSQWSHYWAFCVSYYWSTECISSQLVGFLFCCSCWMLWVHLTPTVKKESLSCCFCFSRCVMAYNFIFAPNMTSNSFPKPLFKQQVGNIRLQSSQLLELLRTDPGIKCGISVHELISTLKKKKAQAGIECANLLPKSSQARIKHHTTTT